jgi:HEAT repeat protein
MTTNWREQFLAEDEARCEAAAVDLGRQGPATLPEIAELLAADSVDVRFWAVRALWANGSAPALALLLTALADESEMVASGAALALGELKATAAITALAELLGQDPSATGNHAADALSKIGQAATPALIVALNHKLAWVRVRAARALLPLEDRRAIGPLFQALQDDSYMVRHYAELALERMGVGQMVYFT